MKRFIPLLVLIVSCKTAPPSVIGVETRQELQKVTESVTIVEAEAREIDAQVKGIAEDVATLETKAPEHLKVEIKAIGEKLYTLSLVTAAHKEESIPAVNDSLVSATNSFDNDLEAVVIMNQELKETTNKLDSVKSQRNTLALILLMNAVVIALMLIARRFIVP